MNADTLVLFIPFSDTIKPRSQNSAIPFLLISGLIQLINAEHRPSLAQLVTTLLP
jgi:hypothetical protein